MHRSGPHDSVHCCIRARLPLSNSCCSIARSLPTVGSSYIHVRNDLACVAVTLRSVTMGVAGLKTVELYLKKTKSQELIVRLTTLVLIYLLAFSIRLVSIWYF
jgi:hypothetical protein